MKKIIGVLLVVLMAMILVGCGSNSQEKEPVTDANGDVIIIPESTKYPCVGAWYAPLDDLYFVISETEMKLYQGGSLLATSEIKEFTDEYFVTDQKLLYVMNDDGTLCLWDSEHPKPEGEGLHRATAEQIAALPKE